MIEEKRLRELIKNNDIIYLKRKDKIVHYFRLNEIDFEVKSKGNRIELYNKITHIGYNLEYLLENIDGLETNYFGSFMDYLFYIEHLKDDIIIENNNKSNIEITPIKFLLVEDGSVNEKILQNLSIPYLIYRQGANKPEIIEM